MRLTYAVDVDADVAGHGQCDGHSHGHDHGHAYVGDDYVNAYDDDVADDGAADDALVEVYA